MGQIKHTKVSSRNESFVDKTKTRIWQEIPEKNNPYIAEQSLCHGYDIEELIQHQSFIDVFYLLFRGELPNTDQAQLLQQLMIALINPGPRHPATRAAMNAGVGKSDTVHILPIALAIMGGGYQGAGNIEASMRFLRKQLKKNPEEIAQQLLESEAAPEQGDWEIAPGFGRHFGGIDIMPAKLAEQLLTLPGSGKCLEWGHQFACALGGQGMGWYITGLAAAVYADLGFQPRMGAGLFQLMRAPGLLAHGIELANKPTTAMPFIKDEHYVIEK